MVVDDRVRVVVADPLLHAATAQRLRAVAGNSVPGPQETRVAADIHVLQITRARPLVAVGRLPNRPRSTRDAGPVEHLPDGRVRKTRRPGHKPRPPAGLPTAVANPLLQIGGEKPRRAVRTAMSARSAGRSLGR